MKDKSDRNHDRHTSGFASGGVVVVFALVVVLLIPVLYVLSVGPAVMLAQHQIISESLLETVYAPLIWIGTNSETVNHLLSRYVELWY